MARTTLAEIAAAAGVTVPTVSKVLNGRSDVSPTTRARVLELLAEGGYERRRRPAPAPAPGLLALVMDGVEGSWATRVLGGVEHAAAEADCDVLVVSTRRGRGRDWVDRLARRGATGAVLAMVELDGGERDRLESAGVEIVALDPGVAPPQELPSVGTTNWAGGYAAVEHLVGLGHERIAAIGGRATDQLNSTARLDGHRSALIAAGLPAPASRVRHAGWSRSGGHASARDLLDAPDRPTAVFACSDLMASGVYDAAAERGLRVPGDLSVVGFDDLPEARWLTPQLTTVRQPVREMAAEAVRIVLRRRAGGPPEPGRVELSAALVVRDSTAPPA